MFIKPKRGVREVPLVFFVLSLAELVTLCEDMTLYLTPLCDGVRVCSPPCQLCTTSHPVSSAPSSVYRMFLLSSPCSHTHSQLFHIYFLIPCITEHPPPRPSPLLFSSSIPLLSLSSPLPLPLCSKW